jgi:predicted dehydrogenase
MLSIVWTYRQHRRVNAVKDILAVQERGEPSHARANKTQHGDPVKRQPAEAAQSDSGSSVLQGGEDINNLDTESLNL